MRNGDSGSEVPLRRTAPCDLAEEASILQETGVSPKSHELDAMVESPVAHRLGILPLHGAFGSNGAFGEVQPELNGGPGRHSFGQQEQQAAEAYVARLPRDLPGRLRTPVDRAPDRNLCWETRMAAAAMHRAMALSHIRGQLHHMEQVRPAKGLGQKELRSSVKGLRGVR